MDDRDYQLIVDLYRLKNVTLAAAKHYMSQPAMTKRINGIEAELGAKLMLRGRHGVVITAFGESIVPYCQSILEQRRQMLCALSSAMGEVGGTLNVLCSAYFSHYRLPDVLLRYTRLYPKVKLSIATAKSGPVFEQLRGREDCVGIVRGEYPWAEKRVLLSSEPMCLIRGGENVRKPLGQYAYISHRTDGELTAQAARWAREQGLPVLESAFLVDDIHACKEMVRRGIGWSILPSICLHDFDGEAEPLRFADGTPFVRNTYALCHEAYAGLDQVSLFLNALTLA